MSCKKCKCKVCSCIVNEQVKIAINKIVQNPDEKGVVNIKVPTKTSELINDSGFGQGGDGGGKIEEIRVNENLAPIINKVAQIKVPTKTSDLTNDSNFVSKTYVDSHIINKNNPHNVTKEQINLGNVDNTSDLNKPISTATQNALNTKLNASDVKDEVVYQDLKPVNSVAIEKYAVKKVNTIEELRATNGEYEGQIITLLGYYVSGDKEPLNYKWTSSIGIDDGGSVISTNNGSWIADLDYIIDIRHFGAKCDLINSDSTFIEKCQQFILLNRPLINISAGNERGGGIIYFPKSLLITETIVLKKGVSIQGNSKTGTNIHCYEQMVGITNFDGYDENGVIKTTNNFSLKDFVISQGSILISATSHCLFENLRVMNIVGHDAFVFDGLFVDCKIKNVHIISCDRTGFVAKDYLGTGPSTTLYVDGLYVQRCNIGIVIDGNSGSSHYILTSTFKNVISEYNTTGIILQGNIENVSFDGVHLEQNDTPIGIYDSVSVNLNNVWNDKGMIVLYNGDNQYNNKVYLKDIKSQLYVQNGYSGSIFVDSNIEWIGNPNTCIIYNSKGNTYNDSSEYSNRAPIGYTSFDKSLNKIVVFNGTNWVDSQGNIV